MDESDWIKECPGNHFRSREPTRLSVVSDFVVYQVICHFPDQSLIDTCSATENPFEGHGGNEHEKDLPAVPKWDQPSF